MAVRNCPECGGKVSTTRSDCPHCGYKFDETIKCPECEEQIPADSKVCPVCGFVLDETVQERAELTKSSSMPEVPMEDASRKSSNGKSSKNGGASLSSFGQLMSVIKRHSEDEFLREVYVKMASTQLTPADVVESSNFLPVKSLKTPYMLANFDVFVNFTCSIGYDRQEQYWDVEKKKGSDGNWYDEKVLKTRTVTDWQPFSGTNSGTYWKAEAMTHDKDVSVPSGYTVLDLCSGDDVEEFTQEDAQEFSDLTPDPSILSTLEWFAKDSCYNHAPKPGDHHKDDHYDGTADLLKLWAAVVPHYNAEYTYNGASYKANGLASTNMQVSVDTPSDSTAQDKLIKKKLRPLKYGIIGIVAVLAILAVLSMVLFVADGLYFLFFIFGGLALAFGLFSLFVYFGIKKALQSIRTFTKQTDKIAAIDRLFAEKGWNSLSDEECEAICPRSLREEATGNKKGWDKFVFGITTKYFVGTPTAKSGTSGYATGKGGAKARKPISKKTIKLMAICLACVLVVSLSLGLGLGLVLNPSSSGFKYSRNDDGTITITGYTGKDTSVVIPTQLKGKEVSAIGSYAFENCGLTSITIPDSVTSVSSSAFANCNIENATIPTWAIAPITNGNRHSLNTVVLTVGDSISENAFANCSSLTSITIPESVTSIGHSAFRGCSSLTSIIIPFVGATKGDTSYTHFGYLFGAGSYHDNSSHVPETLTTVVITGGENIGEYAFFRCSSLTSITIPDSVTSIGDDAFDNCTSLTSIVIPSGVTSIGYAAFYNCTSLTSITIPESVTSIGNNAFQNCSNLETVYWNATNCTSAGSQYSPIFENCSNLTTVVIGDNVQIIPAYAFYDCTGLTDITIPDSVTSISSYAFYGCSSLTSITIPDSVTSIGSDAFYNCSSLESIGIPDNVTSIGYEAFYNCSSLTSITIPGSVASIGDYAFANCSSLTSITIPESVTSIGHSAFYGCSSLTSIIIPFVGATKDGTSYTHFGYIFGASSYDNSSYVPETLTTVVITGGESIGEYAFYRCSSLTSIIIPDSVTSIGDDAFYNCTSLTSIVIPSGVTSIGYAAFYNCTGLTDIRIPDSVTSISSYAFYGCSGLTSITIPDSVTSIGYYAFANCSNITTVYWNATECDPLYFLYPIFFGCNFTSLVIGDNVTMIPDAAFYNCSSLTSITIPDSVTSIGSDAFYGCSSLTSITIPGSVTSIGYYAFANCSSLTSITIPDSVTSIGYSAFYGCSSLNSVKFENPTGWWRASSSEATSGTKISSIDLADPTTAATYLTSTYLYDHWKRS